MRIKEKCWIEVEEARMQECVVHAAARPKMDAAAENDLEERKPGAENIHARSVYAAMAVSRALELVLIKT